VGTPFHDHARVSFAVKLGTPKAKIKNADRRAWYQKMTLKQWQGISHQIDDSLRSLANQSPERLKGGGGDADLEKRKMIEARIRAAEMVKQDIPKEHKTRMPFRSTLQQTLLRKRSTMEAALREAVAKKGITMLQLTCMHDLGITTSRNLSLQDQELLLDAPEWRALLQAEIQSSKNQLDSMAKKHTRRCEHQAKRQEAREYLRDKKGPSKFCGNTHSLQMPKELVLGMPVGIMWINQDPTTTEEAMEKKVREAVPSVSIQWSQAEVALLFLATTEEQTQEFETKLATARKAWKWRNALRKPQRLLSMLRSLCLQRQQSSPTEPLVRELAQEAVSTLWEAQKGYQHDMTIGNGGSHHREERSWWAQGPGCFERISEWERWIQQDHSSTIEGMLESVTSKNGKICVKVNDAQSSFQIRIQDGRMTSGDTGKSSQVQPLAHANPGQHAKENLETTVRKTYPSTRSEIWHGPPGAIRVMYAQVQKPLEWEALATITKEPEFDPNSLRVVMKQGIWSEKEKTIAWESYMQTEGLSQQVSCQHCDCRKKPIVVVTQGNTQPRRQLVGFCTSCWNFTNILHHRDARMDISFFKQFNPDTGKFRRALPYADEQHPRRIRGPITDHEMDHFRRDRLKLRKAGGPDKETNELYRSLTMEELAIVRVWADRVLQDAQSASSVLTDEMLNCSIRLLHKGGDTSDKPSDWRPIGLLNVGMQLVHHIINYRLTLITEAENLIVPGQDGGRAGRGVDLNQLKLDWVTSEARRLRQRIIRIDIDFKNAFNSMSQTALWAVMRAYNIPDVDLLEVIYGRTTACMDSDDAECAIITFLTGVIQGGASSPRIFIIFINALLEHLTSTGKALGISHGMVGTEQFNNIAFMDDITTLAQDNPGSQILLDAIQEFEDWSNMRLNLGKTVVMDIDGGSGQQDLPTLTYKGRPVKTFQAEDSCRHLGFWATPNGDMAKTKQRVLAKTREVLGLLTHHPLESKIAKELFHSMAVSVFRFSAAQVRWSKAELDQLRSLWVQAYKRADHLPKGTASDIFIFPEKRGGEELSTPINIIA
jgi:hypothetical protein